MTGAALSSRVAVAPIGLAAGRCGFRYAGVDVLPPRDRSPAPGSAAGQLSALTGMLATFLDTRNGVAASGSNIMRVASGRRYSIGAAIRTHSKRHFSAECRMWAPLTGIASKNRPWTTPIGRMIRPWARTQRSPAASSSSGICWRNSSDSRVWAPRITTRWPGVRAESTNREEPAPGTAGTATRTKPRSRASR